VTAQPGVALTFDDGPDPVWTPRVLDALAAEDVTATFFAIGASGTAHPEPVRRALAEGHDVQLHCQRHVRHTELGRAALEADTDAALAALGALGVAPVRWRTPWGVLGPHSEAVAAARGLTLTPWTTDTEDWAGEPAATLLERVRGDLRRGAVVLVHDGIGPGATREGCDQTVALIGPLVAAIRAAGLEPGPLPDAGSAG
jgi:peptidoglycan-N-acetylglucosamine deacetylase